MVVLVESFHESFMKKKQRKVTKVDEKSLKLTASLFAKKNGPNLLPKGLIIQPLDFFFGAWVAFQFWLHLQKDPTTKLKRVLFKVILNDIFSDFA